MGRTHAWVPKGTEFIERRPMNKGKNLTLLGAIRLTGWVQQSSMFATTNADRFVEWLKLRLLPKLSPGDVLIVDALKTHHDPRVAEACRQRDIELLYQPPYSPDFNPIEPGWALQKQYVRRCAPRTVDDLQRVARRARYRIIPLHCRQWFQHAGYAAQSK